MKLLIVSYTDGFGAGRAAYRLFKALKRYCPENAPQIDPHMLVGMKAGKDPDVIGAYGKWGQIIDAVQTRVDALARFRNKTKPEGVWSTALAPFPWLYQAIKAQKPDLVHLHWLGRGLSPKQIKALGVPVTWTLHDMAAFTGGCHYDAECGRYELGCGACPQLGSRQEKDISAYTVAQKTRHWADVPMTVISPSRWLGACAGTSQAFADKPVEIVSNTLDLETYKPRDAAFCRDLLGLPQDKKIILFGAVSATSDTRKGFDHLQKALKILSTREDPNKYLALVFGAHAPATPPDFGLPIHYLGSVADDAALAALYAASDVAVVPSVQENLANVVAEALACGTPVAAFNIGGMPDMIEHEKNGYLARPFDAGDLAKGIADLCQDHSRTHRAAARHKAEEMFSLSSVAAQHVKVYENLLHASS